MPFSRRHGRTENEAEALEPDPACNDIALDVGGARVERGRHGIAQLAFDLAFFEKPAAAKNSHEIDRGLQERLAREELGY